MASNGGNIGDSNGRSSSSDSSAGVFVGGMILGAVVGTAAGAIAGILAAPQEGKETRKILKQSAEALPELTDDVVESVQFQTQRLAQNSLNGWEQSIRRIRTAITAGLAASKKERQRLAQLNTQSSASDTNANL